MKKKNTQIKLFFLRASGILCYLLPLIILFIINRDKYFQTKTALSVSFGCVVALIVVILMVLKVKILKGIVPYIIFFVLAKLFEPIADDISKISLCALVGASIYNLGFKPFIVYYSKKVDCQTDADIKMEAYAKFKEATK